MTQARTKASQVASQLQSSSTTTTLLTAVVAALSALRQQLFRRKQSVVLSAVRWRALTGGPGAPLDSHSQRHTKHSRLRSKAHHCHRRTFCACCLRCALYSSGFLLRPKPKNQCKGEVRSEPVIDTPRIVCTLAMATIIRDMFRCQDRSCSCTCANSSSRSFISARRAFSVRRLRSTLDSPALPERAGAAPPRRACVDASKAATMASGVGATGLRALKSRSPRRSKSQKLPSPEYTRCRE